MQWIKKNRWKILTPLLVLAVLAVAYYVGGSGKGTTGWRPSGGENRQEQENLNNKIPKTEQPSQREDGKDAYLTDPVPEGKPKPVEPQEAVLGSGSYSCTVSVSCRTLLDNKDLLSKDKWELVPEDGWILAPVTVSFQEGESAFTVLQRVLKDKKIHMEYVNTPLYNSAYIEGIGNLYEFDAGELSGWMYKINDWFPNYGCSRYQLSDGDVVCWEFTCDLGNDVGGGYAAGSQTE